MCEKFLINCSPMFYEYLAEELIVNIVIANVIMKSTSHCVVRRVAERLEKHTSMIR